MTQCLFLLYIQHTFIAIKGNAEISKKNGGENVLQIGELSRYETVLFPFEKAGFFGTFETAVFETFEFSFFSIRYIQTNKFMSYSIILVFKG